MKDKAHRILLAEDEKKLGHAIKSELARKGYFIDIAKDGNEAMSKFIENSYSMYILDINLPYVSGLELCREFRLKDKKNPIIMLTALEGIKEKMQAFQNGADDYLVKPFHFEELFARINVFIMRIHSNGQETETITVADLEIDIATKTVKRQDTILHLTVKEFSLLVFLCRNSGKVVSKTEIMQEVWDMKFDTGTNSIEVYISFLRNKVDKPFETKLIHTKPGFGYYIQA